MVILGRRYSLLIVVWVQINWCCCCCCCNNPCRVWTVVSVSAFRRSAVMLSVPCALPLFMSPSAFLSPPLLPLLCQCCHWTGLFKISMKCSQHLALTNSLPSFLLTIPTFLCFSLSSASCVTLFIQSLLLFTSLSFSLYSFLLCSSASPTLHHLSSS